MPPTNRIRALVPSSNNVSDILARIDSAVQRTFPLIITVVRVGFVRNVPLDKNNTYEMSFLTCPAVELVGVDNKYFPIRFSFFFATRV